jgi:hypothetical protein
VIKGFWNRWFARDFLSASIDNEPKVADLDDTSVAPERLAWSLAKVCQRESKITRRVSDAYIRKREDI